MSFQVLNIAASSLRSQQKSIDVVSHNIANVNTPGYSRQSTTLVTATPERIGGLDFGRGVNLQSVVRTVDPFINSAQQQNNTQFEFWNTVHTGLVTIESAFGSLDNTGLAASVNDFFLSWQQLSNNPQDTAQKYNVRAKSTALINQMNNMQTQLVDGQNKTDQTITLQLSSANLKLDEIAALTQQIQAHETTGLGTTVANDLRDQRDQAVRDLAKIIPIQEVSTQDGGILLQTMGGDLLSQDGTSRHLVRSTNQQGSSGYFSVVLEGTNTPVQGLDQGGTVGGLIKLRDEYYQGYLNSLDSFANNLAFTTNQIHSSAANGIPQQQVQSSQGATNPTLPLNDPTQTAPFASQVQAGSFILHAYDATGVAISQTTISLPVGASMNDIAQAINLVPGITSSVDPSGRLNIDAGTGSIAFSNDTSQFLAAYEINSFFHGSSSGNLTLSQHIENNVNTISTGYIDPITSIFQIGDSRAASNIVTSQDSAISIDGSSPASLHERVANLSSRYGLDVGIASQQRDYRQTEASSLIQQREAISGVNVDEELIAMMKFQKAYEASAKVISTSNQMLDSLMGILR